MIPPENAKMSTITQRVQTAGVGRLSLGPARLTGSQQPQGKAAGANDLLKVLDPAHRGNYVPSFSLPTPPPSAHASEQGADHPALANVLDLPLPDLLAQAIQHRSISGGGEDESAFFAADLSAVYEAVQLWRNSPIGDRVELFYAVKCNPSPIVLHLLSLLGASFDCASADEINQVLSLPCAPKGDRIIFANPCKPASFVRTAAEQGVDMMTFDNADELHKVRRLHPGAKLVLRILTDDSKSLCRLGLKYGAPLDTCPGLLKLARELDLDVVGVSFHVGSGCKDPMQFADAVWRAKRVFDMGKQVGYEFGLLDIGGGFERETFAEMSEVVRDGLDLYFPKESGVRVIAEPGRFLVSSAFTLATNIIAQRRAIADTPEPGPSAIPEAAAAPAEEHEGVDVMYYINDGVYGAFNCIMFDHQIVHPYPLTLSGQPQTARPPFPPPPNVHMPVDLPVQLGYQVVEKASVWGPTCDSIDCVREVVKLPKGMAVGDWIGWGEMGAYTLCASSTFNGFQQSPVLWTTGGTSPHALAVRATLDAFAGPSAVCVAKDEQDIRTMSAGGR